MRVICMDMWNTLCRSLDSSGASYQDILVAEGVDASLVYPFVRDRLMTQRATYAELAQQMLEHFGMSARADLRRRIVRAWQQDNDRADWFPGARELVAELRRRGDRVGLVTNITQPAWKATNRRLGLEWEFDFHYLSWGMGHCKPCSHVWSTVEAAHQGAELWMVGDNQTDDLDEPARRGWNTLRVEPDGSSMPEVRRILLGPLFP